MVCITGTFYTMKADIYIPSKIQNSIGMVQNTWAFDRTISCSARTILRESLLGGSSSVDVAGMFQQAIDTIKLRSKDPIDPHHRLVNLRNSDGVIWVEDNTIDSDGGVGGATIFEPRGSTPIIDFDGKVLEYETLLQRQEIQKLVEG